MSRAVELQILREEERVLTNVYSKLNDQLNRLKVEELALLSRIRNENAAMLAQQEKTPKQEKLEEDSVNLQPLDLGTELQASLEGVAREAVVEEEEEEVEPETEHDELTHFLQQLQHNS